jgi:glycosyltransferase involved in cell wall biosynthesis
MTLQEAMVTGMPVISSNCFDNILMIRNKKDGFNYERKEDLPELIQPFLDDLEFAKIYGEKARKRAEELFPENGHKKIFENAINKAIKSGMALPQIQDKKMKYW